MEHDNDCWRVYNVPGGLAAHIRPHRSKKTMGVYLSMTSWKKERNPELDQVLSGGVSAQKAHLHKLFSGIGWEAERFLSAMDKADDFYMQQVALVDTPKWASRRYALIGDSAHCTMGKKQRS
jgi:2-polyprenyl-6-methoxyphenol hydroxylase-like FAD-dependent oxidoreductase